MHTIEDKGPYYIRIHHDGAWDGDVAVTWTHGHGTLHAFVVGARDLLAGTLLSSRVTAGSTPPMSVVTRVIALAVNAWWSRRMLSAVERVADEFPDGKAT